MNNRRFIELLNLYVDEQLDSQEAAELEAEVLANPARRRTYDQYCRLHRGCCLLSDGSRALAPGSQAFARSLREAERKIAAPRRSSWRPAYVGVFSAAAMAACVAVVVVVNRQNTPGTAEGTIVASELPSAGAANYSVKVAADHTTSVTASPVSLAFDTQPALAATGLGVVRSAREAEIVANDREALEWMQRVELMPSARVVVDEQAFEARPTLQQDNRVFRSRHSIQGSAEFTAFQFQR